jgi:hypothetical protein
MTQPVIRTMTDEQLDKWKDDVCLVLDIVQRLSNGDANLGIDVLLSAAAAIVDDRQSFIDMATFYYDEIRKDQADMGANK